MLDGIQNKYNMKPILMLHELTEAYFDAPLENYILTFDDGLYSQYHFWDRLKAINTKKIFFISSGIICTGAQAPDTVACTVAHQKARQGNFENFLTIDQIKTIQADPNTIIGGHSHSHREFSEFSTLAEKVEHIKHDTDLMINWFSATLNQFPSYFCFPYNNDLNGIYTALLKNRGITKFYGSERIPVETLLHTGVLPDSPYISLMQP